MPRKDSEARREYNLEWKRANKEKVKQYRLEWKAKNPDRVKSYKDRYRGRYGPNGTSGLTLKQDEQFRKEKYWCRHCGYVGPDMHIDHKIPRSRGGSNKLENLQWLCKTCNMSKADLTVKEYFDHIEKVLNFRAKRIIDLDEVACPK